MAARRKAPLESSASYRQANYDQPISGRFRIRNYKVALFSLFTSVVILSGTDLLTTSIALGQGLREGNMALLDFARTLNLTFFEAISLLKLGFILGAGVLVILGMKSKTQSTRNLVLTSMAIFAIMLLFVSLNNLIMIGL